MDTSILQSDLVNIASKGLAVGVGNFLNGAIEVFSNYDRSWQEEYFANDWMTVDPVVTTGVRHLGTFDWPALNASDSTFATAAQDFGLTNGIIVSQSIGGSRCIAGISSDKPLSGAARHAAEMQIRDLHFDQLVKKTEQFTDTQRQLVYMFANGYRAKNVAEALDVSEDAIKQRKLQIQRQLGVNSFMVVVNICARAGMTFHPIS